MWDSCYFGDRQSSKNHVGGGALKQGVCVWGSLHSSVYCIQYQVGLHQYSRISSCLYTTAVLREIWVIPSTPAVLRVGQHSAEFWCHTQTEHTLKQPRESLTIHQSPEGGGAPRCALSARSSGTTWGWLGGLSARTGRSASKGVDEERIPHEKLYFKTKTGIRANVSYFVRPNR